MSKKKKTDNLKDSNKNQNNTEPEEVNKYFLILNKETEVESSIRKFYGEKLL